MTEAEDPGDWIPIALSRDIGAGTAAPVTVAGAEVALWRDATGAVHAWQDRCPHRGMRLSFGFVRGEQLTCLYHGWRYGPEGSCRYIPAHPDLRPPDSIRADIFPCVERGGLVWMRTAVSGLAEAGPPETSANAIPVRSLAIEAPAKAVHERLDGAFGSPAVCAVRIAANLTQLENVAAGADWAKLDAAVQPVRDRGAMLHLLVVPADRVDRAALLDRMSRKAETLRRACEARAQTFPAMEVAA